MATLFRVGSYRIVLYSNDHRPAHVHAVGEGHARFLLGTSADGVQLIEQHGVPARELRRIAGAITLRHAECLAGWRKHHAE
jgi:hypothetical protein